MVDSWRAIIGAQPHLAKWFFGPDGKPNDEYKAKVKKRFVQWVLDVCFRPHDQAWLDYQEEIGLRHTPEKKNQTDGVQTPPVVPLRYLTAFGTVVAMSTRKFFVDAGVRDKELQKLEGAWSKAVQLHITLWSRPYVKEGLWWKWLGSSEVLAAFALFPADISRPPREWAERFFNVRRWTEMPRGGHFAAMEEPELLAEDIRNWFRPFRAGRDARVLKRYSADSG